MCFEPLAAVFAAEKRVNVSINPILRSFRIVVVSLSARCVADGTAYQRSAYSVLQSIHIGVLLFAAKTLFENHFDIFIALCEVAYFELELTTHCEIQDVLMAIERHAHFA